MRDVSWTMYRASSAPPSPRHPRLTLSMRRISDSAAVLEPDVAIYPTLRIAPHGLIQA
jgi:hypothetical protein